MSGEVTDAIAAFACNAAIDDVPPAVLDRVRIHVLDTLGLALAGSVSEAAALLREHYVDQGIAANEARPGWATIFGTLLFAPPRFAACANGAAVHADNFDDTTPQVRADRTGGIHASGAVLPAVLALAEARDAPAEDVVVAYLVGVEVASRLNHAMAPRHYGDGFHTTGTLTVFGAAAAAASLMRLDRPQIVHALALAASQASGIRRNFGTMAEILHPGHAAECGIAAADLAARGMTGASDALDGPVGYFAAAGGAYDASEIVGKLGKPWVFESPGVWIKPFPNGALTHPAASALLGLLTEHEVAAEDIRRIDVRTNARVLNTLIHHKPESAMQAKFSMEFTLAMMAVDRQVGLGEFTDAALERPDVRRMMDRVDYSSYDRALAGYTNVTSLLEVELEDGRRLTRRADYAPGSSSAPMDLAAVAAKFRQCATYGGFSDAEARRIVDELGRSVLEFGNVAFWNRLRRKSAR